MLKIGRITNLLKYDIQHKRLVIFNSLASFII
jgi:hypothetical protein